MSDQRPVLPIPPVKLMHRFRAFLRTVGLAWRTEQSYVFWVKELIKFHSCTHPSKMDKQHCEAFLSAQVLIKNNHSSTQRQAAASFRCFFNRFLKQPLGKLDYAKSKKPSKLKQPFSRREVELLLSACQTDAYLPISFIIATGVRLQEFLDMRICDIDFDLREIWVRHGKGGKSRVLPLPLSIYQPLRLQYEKVLSQHNFDLENGQGFVYIPKWLARNSKSIEREFRYQYLFPANKLSEVYHDGRLYREAMPKRTLQSFISRAIKTSGITKSISCHNFRHTFASQLCAQGCNIREIQALMGHESIATTQRYLHRLDVDLSTIVSPIDMLYLDE